MMRIVPSYVGALFLSLSFVVALFFLGMFAGAEMSVAIPQDPCPGELGETNACWSSFYESVIAEHGARGALRDLKRRYEAGDASAVFCHPILHQIGAAAGKEYGSVSEAYEEGETFCRAGYFHGVLEGIFGEGENGGGARLLENIDTICAAIPGKDRYSYNYYSCVHGIGHGLMAYFEHDIFKSLKGCDRLSGKWEQGSCYGGVFMENVISNSPEFPSKFLKKDDPLYPCTVVEDRQKYQCYQMQTSYMLVLNGGDFGHVFETCARVEEEFRIACFQSIGRDASGWSYGDTATALNYCAQGETLEARAECVLGVAVDYIQSVNPAAARAVCAQAEDGARVPCLQAVEWQIGAL